MYNRILVPIDGSENAKNAAFKAVEFAKEIDATVVITYIFDQRSFNIADNEEEGQIYINEVKEYASNKSVKAEDLLIYGNRENDIMIIARKSEIDLIMLAKHGNSKIKNNTMGKFTEFIIKNIDKPVLLI